MNTFQAVNPATNENLSPAYPFSSRGAMNDSVALAVALTRSDWVANDTLRAAAIRAIIAEMQAAREAIVEMAGLETALPAARLNGELDRTCMQLGLFADLISQPGWRGPVDVPADPARTPLPRPRLQKSVLAIGPVAVFGASNFPLAYSVMGGDSASALAAGCPIIVKGHGAHPGTTELVAGCVRGALDSVSAPDGVFACHFLSNEDAAALVQHPDIAGVGFTGSLGVGRHLMDLAAARPRPIPVFAEMGSMNPQFVFPTRLKRDPVGFSDAYFASLTMGVGQFCTNPGVIVAVAGPAYDSFRARMVELVNAASGATMLSPGIAANFAAGCDRFRAGAALLAAGASAAANAGAPALFEISAHGFLANDNLRHEVFGPAAIFVTCDSVAQFESVADGMVGQLAASVHADEGDQASVRALLPRLAQIAGRVVFNGFPTGLDVGAATVHGGPYPAASDSRFTAVGSGAIQRWLRPICLQDCPPGLLPSTFA